MNIVQVLQMVGFLTFLFIISSEARNLKTGFLVASPSFCSRSLSSFGMTLPRLTLVMKIFIKRLRTLILNRSQYIRNIRKAGLVYVIAPLLLILLSMPCAQGQDGYPSPTDDYVNDYAHILSKSDSKAIHEMFDDLEYQTGIEAVVVTINSIVLINHNYR